MKLLKIPSKNNTILVSLLFLTFGAFSQQELSLENALKSTLASNYNIHVAKIETKQAANNNTMGNAGMLPKVDLSLNQELSIQNQNNPTSFVKGNLYLSNTTPGVELNWLLFNGFKAKAEKSILEQTEERSQNNAELVIQNTLHAVTIEYYRCVLRASRVSVLDEVLAMGKEDLKYQKKKKEVGLQNGFDAEQEEINYLNDTTNYILEKQLLAKSVRKLNQLMGDDLTQTYALSGDFSYPEEINLDSLLKQVPDNKKLKDIWLNQLILKQRERKAKGNLYPTFNFKLGSRTTSTMYTFEQENGGESSGTAPWSPTHYANFTLNFNLFNGGKSRVAIRNAMLDIEREDFKEQDLKSLIKIDLMDNYYDYTDKRSLLSLEERREQLLKQQLGKVQKGRVSGAFDVFDYQLVKDQYLTSKLKVLNMKFEMYQLHLEMLRLTGNINLINLI